MKRLLAPFALILCICAAAVASSGPSLPADEALQMLKDGNARYASGKAEHPRQGPERRAETVKGGQHPIATIIGCSDSREPLELLFDQGVGDLFVIRVAGNIAGASELASLEYGVGHLGTSVVLVLGHTSCGAVTAAAQNAKVHGNIPGLINQIKPAVAKAKSGYPTATGDDLVNRSIKANVLLSMENILRKSAEVREFIEGGKVLLVGGIYDLNSGQIAWLGQHPEQARIMAQAHAALHKPKPKPAPKPAEADAASDAKADAKADTGHDAKPAKAAKDGKDAKEAVNPNARSEGMGELLAPDKAPEKPAKAPAGHAPAAKSAHP